MENLIIKKIDIFRLLKNNKYVLNKTFVYDIIQSSQEKNIKKLKFPVSKSLERSILDQIVYINRGHKMFI